MLAGLEETNLLLLLLAHQSWAVQSSGWDLLSIASSKRDVQLGLEPSAWDGAAQ